MRVRRQMLGMSREELGTALEQEKGTQPVAPYCGRVQIR